MSEITEKLYGVAGSGDVTEVQKLLNSGADVNAKTRNGETALHSAAIQRHKEVLELLLANGADVNALNGYGETPFGARGLLHSGVQQQRDSRGITTARRRFEGVVR